MTAKTPAKTEVKPSLNVERSGLLQRKCDCGKSAGLTGQCSECQGKKLLQRQATEQNELTEVPPIVHEVLRSPGQPLNAETRTFMEPRFGHNFSQVRVHTDSKAEESAKKINAQAYTVSQHIVFGASKYNPSTTSGKYLLAHELAHVVQQNNLDFGMSSRKDLFIGSPGSHFEQGAEQVALQVVNQSPKPTLSNVGSGINLQSPDTSKGEPSLLQKPIQIVGSVRKGMIQRLALQGCAAPSEVSENSSTVASFIGNIAEDIIFAQFCQRYPCGTNAVFRDNYNLAAYVFFLTLNNPAFSARQTDFFERLRGEELFRIPDFIIHSAQEVAFYEVKPSSISGLEAGIEKVGTLTAVYRFYGLPYIAGNVFTPGEQTIASYDSLLRVTLKAERNINGLILYSFCIYSDGALELAAIAALLRYIFREMIRNGRRASFRPIDLEPVMRRQQLETLARNLGLAAVTTAGAVAVGREVIRRVAWRHFWRAVIVRFAVRGAAMLGLSAADGPLPVGELISLGLSIATAFQIIVEWDSLWRDAEQIANQGA